MARPSFARSSTSGRARVTRVAFLALFALALALPVLSSAIDADIYFAYFTPGQAAYTHDLAGVPLREVWLNGHNAPVLVVTAYNTTNITEAVTDYNATSPDVLRYVERNPSVIKETGGRWLLYVSTFEAHAPYRAALENASVALALRSIDCQLGISEFLDHPNSVAYQSLVVDRWLHKQKEYAALLVLQAEREKLAERTIAFRLAFNKVPTGALNASDLQSVRDAKAALDAFLTTYDNVSAAQQTIARAFPYSFNSGSSIHTCAYTSDFNSARTNATRALSFGPVDSPEAFQKSVMAFLAAHDALAKPTTEENATSPAPETTATPVPVPTLAAYDPSDTTARFTLGVIILAVIAASYLYHRRGGKPKRPSGSSRSLLDLEGD